ncbi:TRAP transporter small permease [Aquibium sp. A9E412]|uniref:TRAP transporter small permease n=1 Tax=Aquibium sp. A9E412 TaxID=2976767 RepID=UPI0025AF297B|nr:TRAP transporter small permease [Aquibium sp. A9E412]MDN2567063.1 TRAP transporter small permease [Aquibium sp. A9E412]
MILHRTVVWLARALAILGGVVLVVITLLTVVSVTGRSLVWADLGPVPGDFELVEAGVGFAVFAFLPWCQLNRGHATVDLFTSFLSPRANRVIDVVSESLMTLAIALIAWRLWYGMTDKLRYGETTFILQFPLWWPYAACMAAAAVAVIVSVYMTGLRVRELAGATPAAETGHGGGR